MPLLCHGTAVFSLIHAELLEFLEKPRSRDGFNAALQDNSGSLRTLASRIKLLEDLQCRCQLTYLPRWGDLKRFDQVTVVTGLALAD